MAKDKTKKSLSLKLNAFLKKEIKKLKRKKTRLQPWALPSGFCFLIALAITGSFFQNKNSLEKAKENLLRENPESSSFTLLAENLLKNQHYREVEKLISLAEAKNIDQNQIEEISREKQNLDPKEIKKQIEYWEQISLEKEDYRDAYLNLASLYYKLGNLEKAKENLIKAKELDPNYDLTKTFLEKLES